MAIPTCNYKSSSPPSERAGRKICSNSKTPAREGQDWVLSSLPQSFSLTSTPPDEKRTTGNSSNDQRSAKTWNRQPQHGQCCANPTEIYLEPILQQGSKTAATNEGWGPSTHPNKVRSKIWKPATVLKKEDTPRSYTTRTNEGVEYRRNRRFLINTPSGSEKQPDLPSVQEQHDDEKTKQVANEHANREETTPSTSTETTGYARLQEAANFPYKTCSCGTVKLDRIELVNCFVYEWLGNLKPKGLAVCELLFYIGAKGLHMNILCSHCCFASHYRCVVLHCFLLFFFFPLQGREMWCSRIVSRANLIM